MYNATLPSSQPLHQTWVKNVYSLWAKQVITCLHSYTPHIQKGTHSSTPYAKLPISSHVIRIFTPYLYTRILRRFNLLYEHLYTLSTTPTINKTKENKKGIQ